MKVIEELFSNPFGIYYGTYLYFVFCSYIALSISLTFIYYLILILFNPNDLTNKELARQILYIPFNFCVFPLLVCGVFTHSVYLGVKWVVINSLSLQDFSLHRKNSSTI